MTNINALDNNSSVLLTPTIFYLATTTTTLITSNKATIQNGLLFLKGLQSNLADSMEQ